MPTPTAPAGPLAARGLSLLALLAALAVASPARADRELIVPFHEAGHLVFDQLSGMRLDASGLGYAGPAGVALRTEKADAFAPGAPGAETKTTTLWLAPSADVFVTDHLSVGALLAVSTTSGSATDATGQKLALPGVTTLTLLPRVGVYLPISDRLGVWPRLSLGWTSAGSVVFPAAGGAPVADTFQAMVMDVDVALVWRMTEVFFVKVGPEVGLTLAGTHTEASAGVAAAADGSVLQISGAVGLGVNVEL